MQAAIIVFLKSAIYIVVYARRIRANAEFEAKTEGNIYAFDSSIFSLCLSVFWWATYKRNIEAVRIHTLLDIRTRLVLYLLPLLRQTTKAMEHIPYGKENFYVFDRGYNRFADLYCLHRLEAYFVLRARYNLKFKKIYSQCCNKKSIKCDQI